MLFFPRDYGEFLLQRVVFLVVLWYNSEENNHFLGRMARCMVEKTYSMGLYGMEAFPVEVEADLSQGLPAFELVGLPDAAVKESRDRVRAAMKNCGFEFPVSRITMNLAPADKKKEGPIYDLPFKGLPTAELPHRRRHLSGGDFPLGGDPSGTGRAAHG